MGSWRAFLIMKFARGKRASMDPARGPYMSERALVIDYITLRMPLAAPREAIS